MIIPLLFILSGGPGSGKSTILEALQKKGYQCVEESGRKVIKQQSSLGSDALPWANKELFRDLMLKEDIANYKAMQHSKEVLFFDRGIPDSLGYSRLEGMANENHVLHAAKKYRYNPKVFITPPWQEIYQQDAERKQSYAEAVATYHAICKVYRELGYQVIEVPKGPLEQRVEFIMAKTFSRK